MDVDDVAEAWRPTTPPSRLRELAAQGPGTARIVATRIGLPAGLAEEVAVRALAGGPDWFGVLRALAAHPATSAERLAELAAHPEESVRQVVAVHRATPKAAVKALARDGSTAVRRALAGREKLPRKVAGSLVADSSGEVRLALVRRVGARPEHLRALAADPDARIRRVVAALGHAGDADLTDPDPAVRRTAVHKRSAPELVPVLDALAHDPDARVRELVAQQYRNRTPAVLARLASDAEPCVRAATAANPFTPVRQLTELADDPDLAVLVAVSQNTTAPPETLARLVNTITASAGDGDPHALGRQEDLRNLVYAALEHPATPPESLRALHAADLWPYFHPGNAMDQPNWPPDLLIEFGLTYSAGTVSGEAERASFAAIDEARHTEPLEDVLAAMAGSPIYYLRRAVANRHTPPEALAAFVRDAAHAGDSSHLDDIAKNPATPVEILLAWAEAGERHYDMLKNPSLPEPVLAVIAASTDTSYAGEALRMLEVRALRAGTETPC
ncbi:variant leucine-rich repeat-containing protein [Streptomyces erythrochromogenes]|uniref:variant leucine-rich repeat-containing protein n=1 Tax=Streptomyces erythrochromogenes TaxID=285574 RepID=UPI00369AAF34